MTIAGVWVAVKIWTPDNNNSKGLCAMWQYQTWQVTALIICIIFIVAFCRIRKGILDHPRETHLD